MNKKLTAKVQKLTAKLPDGAQIFSNSFVIEPDDAADLEKHGIVYAVYSIMGTAEMDTLLTTKVVHDVLHDVYFQHESPSPIQSLERAVAQVKERVVQLSKESGDRESEFSIIVAALWGNVLYIVQYGKGGTFLMRSGALKPINSASEGNFTVASGVVKDGDVVLLGSKGFLDKYPPEQLISTTEPMSQQGLPMGASALILKFVIDTTFSKDEVLDIRSDKAYEEQEKQPTSVGKPKLPKKRKSIKSLLGPRFKLKEQKEGGKKKLIIPAILLLLAGSLYMTSRSSSSWGNLSSISSVFSRSDNQESSAEPVSPVSEVESAISEEEKVDLEEQARLDEQNNVTRLDAEVFYDIAITDESASVADFVVLDDLLVAVSAEGDIYTSSITTPKFVLEDTAFPGVNSLAYYAGDISFGDNEGFKVYSLDSGEIVESYSADLPSVSATYLDFVYSIEGTTITKYTKEGDLLSGDTWGTFADISGAKSMAIDVSIYVLTNNDVLSFTSGVQDEFEISGLDKPISQPTKLIVDADFGNIYIADSGNNRVVVLNQDAELVTQYMHTNSDAWGDIKSIGVSRDESTLYVVSGTKVFEVPLE